MSTAEAPPEVADCVVIGGGLAGLACAHALVRAGRSVHLVEVDDTLGGRARTSWHRGRPVDEGFHVILRGYREVRALAREVGMPRHDWRPISGGVVFHRGDHWDQLAPGPLSLARHAALGPADRLRVALLAADVLRRPEAALAEKATDAPTTDLYLRELGFSPASVEGFFRPLFGPILLDRSLSTDPAYFRWLVAMLARGPASIPSDGIGMLAEWTAASVRQLGGRIETGAPAGRLEPDPGRGRIAGISLADGRTLRPAYVVLATDPPAARALLGELDPDAARRIPTEAASTVTAAFALRRPLYRGKTIVLDCDPPADERDRVDLVCQTTNTTRPGVPEGPHVVLALRVTTSEGPSDGVEEAMAKLARRWAPAVDWSAEATHIGTYVHPFAQYLVGTGVREELPGPRTALDNLILAGDLTRHPSAEGAVGSGREAARIVDALLP